MMRRHYLIIDGYNLMHARGLARRRYGPGQLERCRGQLLRYLSRHLDPDERERTTIVFDSASAPGDLPRRTVAAGMTVCFATPGQEADDTIEELIAAHSAPRQIRLVSSDHRLQRSARRRRGTFVDSDVFVAELDRHGPLVESADDEQPAEAEDDAGEKTGANAGMDAERWLRIFGETPESAKQPAEPDGSSAPIDQADVAALQKEIDRQEAAANPPRPVKKSTRRRR